MTQVDALRGYYTLHASIYDATRWTFLFGRQEIIHWVAELAPGPEITEVGCGTGSNLEGLALRLPNARLLGLDLSHDMLRQAERRLERFGDRVQARAHVFGEENGQSSAPVDALLFSYSLTMMHPHTERILDAAVDALRPGGMIFVADFFTTPHPLFRDWMRRNHVEISPRLQEALRERFVPVRERTSAAYGGVWRWGCFAGRRR